MLDSNISIIIFFTALGFFILNVFVPGLNVLNTIAKFYLQFYNQDPSAWSWEIELRTSKEKF